MYDIHTRTRNLRKLYTPVTQYPEYGYATLNTRLQVQVRVRIRVPHSCTHPEHREFCKPSISVRVASVGAVRLPYLYVLEKSVSPRLYSVGYLRIISRATTPHGIFCELCTPRITLNFTFYGKVRRQRKKWYHYVATLAKFQTW